MEIIFAWDDWALSALACLFVFLLIMSLRLFLLKEEESSTKARRGRYSSVDVSQLQTFSRPGFAIRWFIALLVLYGLGVGFMAMVTSSSTPNANASSYDLAGFFGLESGKDYPLILGDTYGGTTGTAEASAGWFGSSATVDLRPTTTVAVGFQKEDNW